MSSGNNLFGDLIAKAGDEHIQSQRILFEHFFGYVKSITLRYMGNEQEAEEALNDSFLKFFKNLNTYDPSFPLKVWLRKIAVNTCLDQIRAKRKIPQIVSFTKFIDSGVEENFNLDQLEDILPVLQSLPPKYRTVFNLLFLKNINTLR